MINVLETLVRAGSSICDKVIVGDNALQNIQATIGDGVILCTDYPNAKVVCEYGKTEQVNIVFRILKASRLNESIAAETNVISECESIADRLVKYMQCEGLSLDAYNKQVRLFIFDNQLTGIEVSATINQ